MTAPQSLSAERREEVLALQRQARTLARQIATDHFGSEPMIAFPFENRCQELIFAALHDLAERTRAEVEKMREAAILQIQAEAAATEDGETLESLNRVIERLRAVAIEGTGQ